MVHALAALAFSCCELEINQKFPKENLGISGCFLKTP
jgi:hypothetical protein